MIGAERVNKTSEPVNHLKEKENHKFMWSVIHDTPENTRHKKILKAYHIKILSSVLNEQLITTF